MYLTPDTTVRQLVDEHHQLSEVIDSVRQMLVERRATQEVVVATLRGLIQLTLDHFEREEAGGYFAAVADVDPSLAPRARQLLLEHPALAERLFALQLCAVRETTLSHCWQELAEGFGAFCQAFTIHENAEDALLQEAYSDDFPAED